MKEKVMQGKPYAGNPHVRFDEGAGAPRHSGRSALLYIVALLTASGGPYFVKHERESGGGFYDIALEPQLLRWPDIAHAALIEMKYIKAGDPAPTSDDLAKIRAAATDQLDKYSSDSKLVKEWRLNTGTTGILPVATGTVTLHRVLVFHGGECVLSEEV